MTVVAVIHKELICCDFCAAGRNNLGRNHEMTVWGTIRPKRLVGVHDCGLCGDRVPGSRHEVHIRKVIRYVPFSKIHGPQLNWIPVEVRDRKMWTRA